VGTCCPRGYGTQGADECLRGFGFLRGIEIAAAENADAVLFVNVDVFGTIRSRTEMHPYNAETLRAQTILWKH